MKTRAYFFILLLTILASFTLVGRGGSGTAGNGFLFNPTVSIDWPLRSRGLDAPSSALSASFVLHDDSNAQVDNAYFAVRSVDTEAHTDTYTFPSKSKIGNYTLSVSFHRTQSASSPVVGTTSIPVIVTSSGLTNPDGSQLSHIQFDHVIKSVIITPNQSLGVGGMRQLTATALDESASPVVVSPGSFLYGVKTGAQYMSLTGDGVATGLSAGTTVVSVRVDGVQSPDANVSVLQELRTTVDVASNDLAFDPISGLIWSTVGNTGFHANSIVGIDPENGFITRSIPLGVTPGLIAITDDGQFAYVNIPSDGTTRRVDLTTEAITLSIPTGSAESMCTVPGSPHTILVGFNPNGGVNVSAWDDTVRRSGTGAGGYFIKMASPTVMYGNGGNSLFTDVLVPGAINWTHQDENLITNDFTIHNGLLIDADGHIVNPATMASVAQLSSAHFLGDGRYITSSDSDDRAYIVTWSYATNKQILCYDLTTHTELPQRDTGLIPGGAKDLVACGNHTVAFRNFGAITSPNQVFIIRGLP